MKWDSVGEMPCSVARSLSLFGDRWTLLIVRNAFLRVRRFEDFQASLGMTRHLLASRLKRLTEAGILTRVPYQQTPLRHEYRLTDKGKALYPVLMALTVWGDTWMDQGKGPPLLYQHQSCGKTISPVMTCPDCHETLSLETVRVLPGPGLTASKSALQQSV